MTKTLLYACLWLPLFLQAGCASKPGDVHYAFIAGTLTAVEGASYKKVLQSVNKAMASLQLRPLEREQDGFRALIVGESNFGVLPQSHEIRVWVKRVTDSTTQIKYRIIGRRDQSRLRAIHSEVQKQLAAPAA